MSAPVETAEAKMKSMAVAAEPPNKSGSTGEVVTAAGGAPVLRIDGRKRRELTLTLFLTGGASRADVEAALGSILDSCWPQPLTDSPKTS